MDAVQKANSGHPGTPMALAPLAYVLYTRVMRHDAEPPRRGPTATASCSRCGHASMLLYSTLYLTGYGLTLDDLKQLPPARLADRRPSRSTATRRGSRRRPARSARASRTAVGMALAERMLAARFNRDGHEVVDHHTYVIASDGDLEEGISPEAARSPATSASAG